MAETRKTFSKKERLCGEIQVTELFQQGAGFMAYPMRVVWKSYPVEGEPFVQVVMSVPKKKLKHAVDRNRVKRLLREAYRLNKQDLADFAVEHHLNVRLAFVWIPNEVLPYEKVSRKLVEALGKLQKLLAEPLSITEKTPDPVS
jgi:ribonuclease P protein component